VRKYTIKYSDEILEDIVDLYGFYYDLAGEESAERFRAEIEKTIDSLDVLPEINAMWQEHKSVRRVNMKHHKVAVVYTVDNNIYKVIAIAAFHALEKPNKYIKKLVKRLKELEK
jgi:plasmid stabilization system protein ParE